MKSLHLTWVTGILIGFFTVSQAYQRGHVAVQQETQRLKQELAQEQDAQKLREQMARSLTEVERLRGALAPEPNTEWLVREVAKRAEAQGLRLTSIVPQQPKTTPDGTQLSVTVQMATAYHQVGKLLSSLERGTPLLWIEDLEIAQGQQNWGTSGVAGRALPQVRLTASTLYVPSASPKRAEPAQRSTPMAADRSSPMELAQHATF